MKRSNKLLVGLLAFILVGITVMMVVAKVYTKELTSTEQEASNIDAPIIIE